ncbi:MAG: ATP-binding cassette domain-containing protein [Actinomycetota bacterium]|nr:ATP-binding cassette domain-containing protein [Actinomycetota bacterium]
MKNVIKVEGLTKKFGNLTAVDHISFEIQRGEIFGFLGPNGAGKSTTVKMLATLLRPTSGKAQICGHDVVKEKAKVRELIGIVFQDRSSDHYLTGRQNLDFHARMYHMEREEREKKIKEVLDLLELNGKENIRLRDLPDGVARRFEVARGFMTSPEVVFLDEPTIGFDIRARMDLWEQIRQAKEKEKSTVLLTTHYIEEADYLSDRVAIIDKAKIVAIGTPEELKKSTGNKLIMVQVAEKQTEFAQRISEAKWVKGMEEYSNALLLNVGNEEGKVAEIVDFCDRGGFELTYIDEHKPSLEDVFLHYTGRTIREAESGNGAKKTPRRRGEPR